MNKHQKSLSDATAFGYGRQKTMDKVYQALSQNAGRAITTREISDYCDISIYAARNWLMRLEEENKAYSVQKDKRTTLWYCNHPQVNVGNSLVQDVLNRAGMYKSI